ncbi:serine hydrolase domain-containing protein [Lutibacter flavus]|uniref:CubicO group peptidase, beta-lactamase class C family n=1 Tax=Lutibacter flavus TaxID=691689 RepID=A0A238ZKS7_9FLAO|nr:serine hydrolase domain-containing protein [Lutibacter flavus]SNR83792.1 CubicO group peptidase, beta-lactamase class C family [Lutibacter flavus]
MHKYFYIVFVLFLSLKLCAQQNKMLDKELQEVLQSENLTGAVWSMFSDSTITTGALGLKNANSKELMNSKNSVQVGSVAKVLIATGILRLSSQDKLDIYSPINKILPNIIFDNPWEKTNPVTVRDLLNHTSGLEDARLWQIFSTKPFSDTPLESVFLKDPSVLRIRTIPSSRFSYSNMGYAMLGLIIEKVTHESYEKYLDANLLNPLGMNNSTFQFVTQKGKNADQNLAMGHFDAGTIQENLPMYLRPAGQFTTTANDMAFLAKFLMSDGMINGEPFIKKELLNQMGKPESTESNINGLNTGYQFGLSYRDRYGVTGYFHRGNTIGFRSTFYLFPEENNAFFISFNTDSETANYQKFNEVFIEHLGIEKIEKTNANDSLPRKIEKYEGFYKLNPIRFEKFAYLDLLFNSIKVIKMDNKLIVKSIQSDSYSLLPVGENLFRKEDRLRDSHVLYQKNNTQLISDGLATYEKVNVFYLGLMWLSLTLGLMGIITIVIRGFYLLVKKKLFAGNQALFVPFVSIILLFLPFPFLINQSFLNLGDLTFANILLAVVTGIFPIAMIFGLMKIRKNKPSLIDVLGVLFALQWAIVLLFWNLIPFRLWS